MSNEDYVKQGRSDKLLGKGEEARRMRRRKSFLGSTIIGVMLALAVLPISVFELGCKRLTRGEGYEKTRGEVLRCP